MDAVGDDEDGEGDEYVAGDPERPSPRTTCRIVYAPLEHPFWRDLCAQERIAVVRWLKRGDAYGLLTALATNPSSSGLRSFVAEGLAGGPETGWNLRIASPATGGAPRKADKARLAALHTAVAGDGGDVAALARMLASIARGKRSRRGRFNDPMQIAMVGLAVAARRLPCANCGEPGSSYDKAVRDAALAMVKQMSEDGDDPRNAKRVGQLYDQFLRAGFPDGLTKRK